MYALRANCVLCSPHRDKKRAAGSERCDDARSRYELVALSQSYSKSDQSVVTEMPFGGLGESGCECLFGNFGSSDHAERICRRRCLARQSHFRHIHSLAWNHYGTLRVRTFGDAGRVALTCLLTQP